MSLRITDFQSRMGPWRLTHPTPLFFFFFTNAEAQLHSQLMECVLCERIYLMVLS